MKKIGTLLAAVALALTTLAYAPAPADAHVTTGDGNCTKTWVHPTKYEEGKANQWSLTLDDTTKSGTFGSETYQEILVPQDGKTHTWSYDVIGWNGKYHFADSGTVGPCGTPPPTCENTPSLCPPPVTPPHVKHATVRPHVRDECNCYRDRVELYGRHLTYSLVKPNNTTWEFHAKAKKGWVLPSKIGGDSGWARHQVYTVHTTNKKCPCRKNHTCHKKHPNFQAPSNHCRAGRNGHC